MALACAWPNPLALPALMGVSEPTLHLVETQDPTLSVYRRNTIRLLRRYFRLSMAIGRMPTLVGREFFRARVSNCRTNTFEDAVIFTHDVERCLALLDDFDQQVIARVVLQEYEQEEAAGVMGCGLRTVERRLPIALDQLTGIFMEKGLLRRVRRQ